MKVKHKEFTRILTDEVDNEIREISELIDMLGSSEILTDDGDDNNLKRDIDIMKVKRSTFENVKGLIIKSSIQVEGLDNEITLNREEKKIFFKIVRLIMWFRKLFRIK